MTIAKLVWIIDDDPGIRDVTKIVLEEAGFAVKTIASSQELDAQFKSRAPQVVLLDNLLSGVDGKTVAQQLRSNSNTKDAAIIMMSANPDLQQKAKDAGADDFIKKPYDIAELEELVQKYSEVRQK